MSMLSDYAENALLVWMFTTAAAPTRPTAWFVGLHVGAPGENGANEIGTGSNYARQTATWNTPASGAGTTDNINTLTFGTATTSNWGTVSGVSVWDATTGGNCLMAGLLATSRLVNIGDNLQFAAGTLDLSLA